MENHSFHIVFYVRELGGITVFFVVIEKILKTKKKRWGKALVFEKIGGFCHAELNERVEVATSSYFATDIFVQRIYSVLVAKNYQNFLSRRYINIKKKYLAASFVFGCPYILLLWRGAQNDTHCNCIVPPWSLHDARHFIKWFCH